MKQNMGSVDKAIRLVVAAAIIILYLSDVIGGTAGIVLLVLAIIFLLTSFVGICPLYLPFRFSSKKKKGNR